MEFQLWAIDESPIESAWVGLSPDRWVYKIFDPGNNWGIKYNQLKVDPYSCTVVATYGCLSNMANKVVGYDTMIGTLDRMKKDGKFRSWSGAKLSDGMSYALSDFNAVYGTNFKAFRLNPSNVYQVVECFKKKSGVVTGITVTSQFFKDEQTLNQVRNPVKGSVWHAIYFGKINTVDDYLGKYVQSYEGILHNMVPLFEFKDLDNVLFNTWYWFTI